MSYCRYLHNFRAILLRNGSIHLKRKIEIKDRDPFPQTFKQIKSKIETTSFTTIIILFAKKVSILIYRSTKQETRDNTFFQKKN